MLKEHQAQMKSAISNKKQMKIYNTPGKEIYSHRARILLKAVMW